MIEIAKMRIKEGKSLYAIKRALDKSREGINTLYIQTELTSDSVKNKFEELGYVYGNTSNLGIMYSYKDSGNLLNRLSEYISSYGIKYIVYDMAASNAEIDILENILNDCMIDGLIISQRKRGF